MSETELEPQAPDLGRPVVAGSVTTECACECDPLSGVDPLGFPEEETGAVL